MFDDNLLRVLCDIHIFVDIWCTRVVFVLVIPFCRRSSWLYLVHRPCLELGHSFSSIRYAQSRRSKVAISFSFSHFLYCVQLLTYLILAAGAISTEVVYLAYKGDASITWSQTCGSFGGFCRKATASIVITFVVTLCYAVLSLISSYRLFSKYDAPVACDNKGIEIPVFHT